VRRFFTQISYTSPIVNRSKERLAGTRAVGPASMMGNVVAQPHARDISLDGGAGLPTCRARGLDIVDLK
jgi:hypothetical protein